MRVWYVTSTCRYLSDQRRALDIRNKEATHQFQRNACGLLSFKPRDGIHCCSEHCEVVQSRVPCEKTSSEKLKAIGNSKRLVSKRSLLGREWKGAKWRHNWCEAPIGRGISSVFHVMQLLQVAVNNSRVVELHTQLLVDWRECRRYGDLYGTHCYPLQEYTTTVDCPSRCDWPAPKIYGTLHITRLEEWDLCLRTSAKLWYAFRSAPARACIAPCLHSDAPQVTSLLRSLSCQLSAYLRSARRRSCSGVNICFNNLRRRCWKVASVLYLTACDGLWPW